jgi:CBS domain-containing protein
MKKRESVKSIMTSNVISVTKETPLKEVVDIVNKNKIRHVPITSGEKLVGIVSRTDLNRLTFSALFSNQEKADDAILEMLSLEQVMTSNPTAIDEEATIKEVAEILSVEEYHALPVVDNHGKLTGIVTTTDVIKYLLEQY